ncbi:mitochondrial coiled-coil domain protein 1 isoform 2-T2 [Rhynchonycteris naso]
MGLPLPWLSRCCRLLRHPGPPAPRGPHRCCSQSPKASTEEQTSSTDSGKRSPTKVSRSSELAQVEQLLEQHLELYQALLEGQEGAWEAQALVLKIQKLKEQMRHRESLGGDT